MKQQRRGPGWQRKDLTQGSNYILSEKVLWACSLISTAESLMDVQPWTPSSGRSRVRVSAVSHVSTAVQVCWLAGGAGRWAGGCAGQKKTFLWRGGPGVSGWSSSMPNEGLNDGP